MNKQKKRKILLQCKLVLMVAVCLLVFKETAVLMTAIATESEVEINNEPEPGSVEPGPVESEPEVTGVDEICGGFTFTLPASESEAIYTAKIYLQRALGDVYYTHPDGTSESYVVSSVSTPESTSEVTLTPSEMDVLGHSASTMYGEIANLTPGETITVSDILIGLPNQEDNTVYQYDTAYLTLEVQSSIEGETVTVATPTTSLVTGDNIVAAESITVKTAPPVALAPQPEDMNSILMPDQPLKVGASDVTCTYGDFKFTLPNGLEGAIDTKYTVNVYLQRRDNNNGECTASGKEDYPVSIDSAGQNEDHAFELSGAWYEGYGQAHYGTLTNRLPGDKITINDILCTQVGENLQWPYSYIEKTLITIKIESSNKEEIVTVKENQIELKSDDKVELDPDKIISSQNIPKQPTPITFNPQGNNIIYLLSNFNVVSYKDIEATHIVGPIIAQERAYRTGDAYGSGETSGTTDANYLIASDYSRGVSSYVGILEAIDHAPFDSTFKLNYGFETVKKDATGQEWATKFIPPHFYTRETEFSDNSIPVGVSEEIEGSELFNKIYLYRKDPMQYFKSPNADGRIYRVDANGETQETRTYQNDNYINFATYWPDVTAASQQLLNRGDFTTDKSDEIVVIDALNKTSLILDAGKSYLIQNANMLEQVDIDTPEDENGDEIYDFFGKRYSEPTIINFDGSAINTTIVNGKGVSQFPETLVNGKALTAESGDGGEYSEVGNKIVWNLPNVVTDSSGTNRLVFSTVGPNVAGHIVAPQAELWNYYQSGNGVTWGGGNLNGTAIVKDFHGGNMEMHMWAYSGLEEKNTSLSFPVKKIYTNGNLKKQSFDFILEKVTEKDYTGLANTFDFPYTASSDSQGDVSFPPLDFEISDADYPKIYEFTLREVEGTHEDITYDETVYNILVTVKKETNVVGQTTYVSLKSEYTATKDGESQVSQEITFTNTKNSPIDQKTSYSFTKVSDIGSPLNGAEFLLMGPIDVAATNPVDPTDPANWEAANVTTHTSKDVVTGEEADAVTTKGVVSFEDLELNATYYFKESVAPEGYVLPMGYWKMEVNNEGSIFITAMDEAPELENHELVNELEEIELLDVTLMKKTEIGTVLENAEFMVERVLSFTNHIKVEGGYEEKVTSNEKGEVAITDLMHEGVYRIKETKAPPGHMIPDNVDYWLLRFEKDETTGDYIPKLYEVGADGKPKELEELVMINMAGYVLPATGGSGKLLYVLVGCLFITVTGYYYYFKLQKKRRG